MYLTLNPSANLTGSVSEQADGQVQERLAADRFGLERQSMPGIGPTTAHTLLAELPELGKVNSAPWWVSLRAATKAANVTPRVIFRGGRCGVRSVLYMATVVAVRHNPVIEKTYKHLKEMGKESKVALTACIRKMVTILNTMVKTGEPWRDVLTCSVPAP